VVRKRLPGPHALAVPSHTRDPDALVHRSGRHLFLVPWGDCTLVGVWHVVYRGDPAEARVSEPELKDFLAEINAAYPLLGLTLDDVVRTHCGLVLFGENREGETHLRYGKRSRFIDHGPAHGVAGLASLIGIRYTTARGDAQQAVDWAFRQLGRRVPPCTTHAATVHGGDLHSLHELIAEVKRALPRPDHHLAETLAHNHGTAYRSVLAQAGEDPELARCIPGTATLRAEVIHAVRNEMAVRLADVVYRRTDLGSGEFPGLPALHEACDLMGGELAWSAERRVQELEDARRPFRGSH
jgi:glycerol-3-phosphate dehydrogenase